MTNPYWMHVVSEYWQLLTYCKGSTFDQKIFKVKHDQYAKNYQRLSIEDQGNVTHIINLNNKMLTNLNSN